jgi:phage baseplate assembly protein W
MTTTEQLVTIDQRQISFSPASVLEEIMQNVRMIISTTAGSVPLAREFGVDFSEYVEAPVQIAKAKVTADIVKAISLYEPRAEVMEVTYSGDIASGQLIPTVRIKAHVT